MIIGCSKDADTANTTIDVERGDSTTVDRTPPAVAAPSKEPLDLSLSNDFFAGESLPNGKSAPERFNAAELFDKKDDESVDIYVTPYLEPGEGSESLPELEGGSVTVKKKTK